MANVYGITPTTLREDRFPTAVPFGAGTRPSSDTVIRMISRASTSIDAVLLSLGIASADVTEAAAPVAYGWLADTLALGAAIRVAENGNLGIDSDAIKRWVADWEGRLEKLANANTAATCIPDAFGGSTTDAAGARSHVADWSLTDASEVQTDNAPLFTVNDKL